MSGSICAAPPLLEIKPLVIPLDERSNAAYARSSLSGLMFRSICGQKLPSLARFEPLAARRSILSGSTHMKAALVRSNYINAALTRLKSSGSILSYLIVTLNYINY